MSGRRRAAALVPSLPDVVSFLSSQVLGVNVPFTISAVLAGLLALSALALAWIALYLLLSASNASLWHPFPGLACLGHAPLAIDGLSIHDGRNLGSIVVHVDTTLTWQISFT